VADNRAINAYSVTENCWITMRDGVRLAARVWLPDCATSSPVSAVFEHYPYRKRDFLRGMDEVVGSRLASHGFAYVRVDVRGTGDSCGAIQSEYSESELQDCIEIIAWIAAQPWCTGAVGMRGISWGGFNSLLVAARSPPQLRAIVAHCTSDNMFTDDAHYAGGCLLLINYVWGLQYYVRLLAPPDPAVVGDQWREMWQQRLRGTRPILADWLSHQRFDAYWKHGSVCVNYADITCPVYLVGGLLDGYRDSVPRMLQRLHVPSRGLIGPWSHTIPELANPGPALAFLEEEAAWFDHWLNRGGSEPQAGPRFHTYVTQQFAAEVYPAATPGRWIAQAQHPSPHVATQELFLSRGRLLRRSGRPSWRLLGDDTIVGLQTRYWFPYPAYLPLELPGEQTAEDAKSTCFETESLPQAVDVIGTPSLRIRVRCDRPVGVLAVRLTEVVADGRSHLASFGILNLTHRDGHEIPEPLRPGAEYDVSVSLYFVAHRFRAGSRIRIGLSTGLWPMTWPAPERFRLEILEGKSCLLLPVYAATAELLANLPPPLEHSMPPPTFEELDAPAAFCRIDRNEATGAVNISEFKKAARRRVRTTGTVLAAEESWNLSLVPCALTSSRWSGQASLSIERGDWRSQMCASVRLTCDAENFYLEESLQALDHDDIVHSEFVRSTIRRDLM
jgi:predicted acyl esterase